MLSLVLLRAISLRDTLLDGQHVEAWIRFEAGLKRQVARGAERRAHPYGARGTPPPQIAHLREFGRTAEGGEGRTEQITADPFERKPLARPFFRGAGCDTLLLL